MQSGSVNGQLPTGVLIANEPDVARCNTLASNMKLFSSPCILITNFKGQSFPSLQNKDGSPLLYDRIVCDVPCSGDGTIRKNPNIWNNWNPGRGNHRYFLQLKIARRGVQLLKEGGLMAYSSCAINQIENECVIAKLLEESNGGLELVDMRHKFKGLNFLPGLDDWCVFDTQMNQYKDYSQVPENRRSQICPEMFPTEKTKTLKLDRSMRFLPHLNDDGGFFVAILRKTRHYESKSAAAKISCDIPLGDSTKIENHNLKFNLTHLRDKKPVLSESFGGFKQFYGLNVSEENLLRWSDCEESLYLVSDGLKSVAEHNGHIQATLAGCKMVEKEYRNSAKTKLRFVSSNLHLLSERISKRILTVDRKDFRALVSSKPVAMESLSTETIGRIKDLDYGEILFRYEDITSPTFVSRQKIEAYISNSACESFKLLVD